MDDNLAGLIVLVIPGSIVMAVFSALIYLFVRKKPLGKAIRIIGLILTFLSMLFTLGLTLLLFAHPYMIYAIGALAISIMAFLIIFFLNP